MSSSFISRASGLRQNDWFFDPNSLVSGYEIDLGHFLPNQKVISQMNHTAMINSIWTTNSQSFSYFQNLKVCRTDVRTLFDFCGHADLFSMIQRWQQTGSLSTVFANFFIIVKMSYTCMRVKKKKKHETTQKWLRNHSIMSHWAP